MMSEENALLSAQKGKTYDSYVLFVEFKNAKRARVIIDWTIDLPKGLAPNPGVTLTGKTTLEVLEPLSRKSFGLRLLAMSQHLIEETLEKEIILNMRISAAEFYQDVERATLAALLREHQNRIDTSVPAM
jgi:hypothetical protein